jgi:hypothetical protein
LIGSSFLAIWATSGIAPQSGNAPTNQKRRFIQPSQDRQQRHGKTCISQLMHMNNVQFEHLRIETAFKLNLQGRAKQPPDRLHRDGR